MNIGIDVDGVLTDAEGYQIRHGTAHFLRRGKGVADPLAYDVRDMFAVSGKARTWFWIRHIWKYCLSEPAREQASQTIKRLREDGHKIYIITARVFVRQHSPLGMLFRRMLLRWLKRHGIEYDGIFFCAEKRSAQDKLRACRELEIDVMVEDRADNINAVRDTVGRVICFDAGYNQDCAGSNIVRVHSFGEVYDMVYGGSVSDHDEDKTA